MLWANNDLQTLSNFNHCFQQWIEKLRGKKRRKMKPNGREFHLSLQYLFHAIDMREDDGFESVISIVSNVNEVNLRYRCALGSNRAENNERK